MSRNYDNWEKLVGAVLKREEFRRLALCDSSTSTDFSGRPSFDSDAPHGQKQNTQTCEERDFDCRNSGERLDLSSQETFFFRNVMAIDYGELIKATKTFHRDMLLWQGEFGCVYKGWMHEHYLTATQPGCGITVAIKVMIPKDFKGKKEFLEKFHYLSQLRHPNLIKLFGYSFIKDNGILVSEFMCEGSLEYHLFTSGKSSLNWKTRVKVAIGAARAIAFLHDLETPVIYRDFKSRNILLDGDFNTKLSGFPFARDVRASYGAAPEYVATGQWSTRCDVYDFGAVLLELITGLRIYDPTRPAGKRYLMHWVKPYLNNKKIVSRIVDSRLKGKYPRIEAYEVAKICLQCRSVEPSLRPKMCEVVGVLEKLL